MNHGEHRETQRRKLDKIFRIYKISLHAGQPLVHIGAETSKRNLVNPENLVNLVLFWFLLFSVSLCLFRGSPCLAQGKKPSAPPVEKITDSVVRVGAVVVDTQARTVTCSGVINMDSGAIEYLAVGPRGKLHESLLRLDVKPMHLQVALLLLGLEPKQILRYQGEKKTPQGAPVEIRVRWKDRAGKEMEARAEELMSEMPGNKPVAGGVWVFTGSRILKEGFEADLSHSLIAVWHDPAAILDNPRPGGANNAYIVNAKRTPKQGTKIELVLRALPGQQTARGNRK
jgi:hypothetical protein